MGGGPSNFVNHAPGEAIVTGLEKGADKVAGTISHTIWEVIAGLVALAVIVGIGFWLYKYCQKKRDKARQLTEFQRRYLRNSYRLSDLHPTAVPPVYEDPYEPPVRKKAPPPPYNTYVNINDVSSFN
nr:p14 [Reptilian orthoreovirus]